MSRIVFYVSTVLLLFSVKLQAQSENVKGKIFKIKIERTSGNVAEGYLYDCNSREVLVLPTKVWDSTAIFSVPLDVMKKIKIRRKGSFGRGIAIGVGAGAIGGFLLGYSEGDDQPGWFSYSKEEKGAGGAILGGLVGGGIGALFGFVGKRFEINQDEQALSSACENMKTRTIRQLHGL